MNDKLAGTLEGQRQRQWRIQPGEPAVEQTLMRECGVSPLQARLLLNRGVRTTAEAREFMNPSSAHILSPFLFQHMEKAVARIRRAIDRKEKIFIFGDRDVDGVAGTAILRITLTAFGATVDSHIPAGGEGYGVHPNTLARAIGEGFTLGITVDTGIAELDRVAEAKSAGMDIIIADHHQQKPALPDAFAILHPGVAGEAYPFKHLSGAGVAFKLAMALIESKSPYANRPVVFVDVETTGLNAGVDDIIEIGAVKYRNGVRLAEFSSLIRLGHPLPDEIRKITGITDQELAAGGIDRRDALARFWEFISEPDTQLLGYRFDFDCGFLTAELKRHLGVDLRHPTLDVQSAAAAAMPGLISRSLAGVAEECGVTVTTRHRALPDAQTAGGVFYALLERQDNERRLFHEQLIPLAALAAVADVMPLTGENRAIVAEGMKVLCDHTKCPMGLKCLLERLNLPAPAGRDLAFSLGPLLNAPGRMGDATPALKLLTTGSKQEAIELSEEIIRLNTERKELGKDNFRRLMELAPVQNDLTHDRIICLSAEGIPHGVTGIVASRIKEALGRPVMIILVEDGKGVGTGRSVESLNLLDAVNDCADLLEKFGGHTQAVGVSASPAQIPAFFERLKISVASRLRAGGAPESLIDVDAEMWVEYLTPEILDQISALEPFGKGNPFPKFAIFNAPVVEVRRIGDAGRHLRLRIGNSPQQAVTAVGWGMGNRADQIQSRIDAVFELTRNVWNGRVDLQVVLEEFRTPS